MAGYVSVDGNLDAAQDSAISDDFALRSATASVSGTDVNVSVRAPGIPPSGDIVNNAAYWRVQVSDSNGNRKAIQPVGQARYSSDGFVILTFPAAELGLIKASGASWSAAFLGPDNTLATAPGGGGTGTLQQAKSRDDADLYVSGTYVAGVGTKPIWAIDAKAGYSDSPEKVPVINWFAKKSTANLRIGIYGELTTNPDTQPVDRSQVDPDSILGYTTLFRTHRLPPQPIFLRTEMGSSTGGRRILAEISGQQSNQWRQSPSWQSVGPSKTLGSGSYSVSGVRGRQEFK